AGYTATFVAQYTGAGRQERTGPATWQGLYFAVGGGLAFLLLVPVAGPAVAWGGHSPELQVLEAAYFRCRCFAALPTPVGAAVSGFFAGRGESGTVLLINAAGLAVNAPLAYAWVFGRWGLPAWGIAGAGWATVVATGAAAALALALFLRPRHRPLGAW